MSDKPEIPIACVLSALSPDQRAREDVLLKEHLASVQEVSEQPDGYSYRYGNDLALFARVAELVTLEHRCCPFLDFRLEWSHGNSSPWLHVGGGPRIKEFVRDTFSPKPAAHP